MPDWQEIHSRNGFSITAPILAPLSIIYGFAVRLRLQLFRIRSKLSLPGFVVSIGNLTTGGTGKTPAACMLAELALNEGYKAVILSRGYGGSHKKGVLEVSNGLNIMTLPEESGDEPYLMAKRLKDVPVLVTKDRYEAGLLAHRKYGSDFYILDDGFQYLTLRKDLDLLLIDSSNPFGNNHLLPWGPLREPVKQMSRAGAIIFTRSGGKSKIDSFETLITGKLKDTPIFHARHVPKKVFFPGLGRIYETEFLRKRRIVAFAGIAKPRVFRKTLVDLGADVVFFKGFDDHHVYTLKELEALEDQYQSLDADFFITTEKDWARIGEDWARYKELGILRIDFIITEEQEDFWNFIRLKVKNKQ